MGGKKRAAKPSEELENLTDSASENPNSKPLKKKIKIKSDKSEEKKNKEPVAEKPMNQMEGKKKRKSLDKEKKRRIVPESKNFYSIKPDSGMEERGADAPGGILPEFHIGVFKELSLADGAAREAGVRRLVMELKEAQRAYDELENKEEVESGLLLEAEKDDGLNNCAPSVRYAVRRLIRGVSSSRECARQGFALGLTVLASAIPSIKIDALMKLVVDLLEVSSSMKGQEVKDCLLGRLFAYGAIARSGRLSDEWVSDKSSSSIKDFTSFVVSLATRKQYLQEPAVTVILNLVEKLPEEALLEQVLEAPGLQKWFEGATEVGNPDALLLALKLQEKVSANKYYFGKLLPTPYSPAGFFSALHLSSIANCLKESAFCQPRVHSIWPELRNILLPDTIMQDVDSSSGISSTKKHKKNRKSNSSEEEIEKNLRSFCEVIIEGCLLSSSHDRKHLALDVLLLLLPRLPPSCIPIVLSNKVVQCLIDALSAKESWLHKVSLHFMKEILDWVKDDDVRKAVAIVSLQKHSNGKFDGVTRTKAVKDLMAEIRSESGCMLFIQNLINLFLDGGHASEEPSDQTTDDNSEIGSAEDKDAIGTVGTSDSLKSWIIVSLPSVLKHVQLDSEAKFRVQKEILKFLSVQGIFSSSLGTEVTSFELQEKFRWPKASIPTALCTMCIEQIQLLLSNAQKGEGSLTSGLETNDLGSYFMRFLSTLCNIPSVSLFRTLSGGDDEAFKKLLAMETRLAREERNYGLSTDANKLHALRYLLIQLLLQILLQPGEFSDAAFELIFCCKKFLASDNLLNSSGEDESDDEGAPVLMNVVVDLLLSLLPQSSGPTRSAIEQVFKYFCEDVTDDGLNRMLRVIKKDLKPARHQNPDGEDDDESEEDDEDLINFEESEESNEAETGETGESDEPTDDSDEAETGETGERDGQTDNSKVIAGLDTASKELPEDSDESDGGMDDDAMFRMDTYLARIFQERKNQAGGETSQSQLIHFKLRVLSLLEIYLHEHPERPQVLKVYSNLAQALVNPHTTEGSEQLGQRIWGILQKKIFKAKDCPRGEAVQLPMLESLLEKNLKLAAKPYKKKKALANPSQKKQSASWTRHKMINSLAQNSTYWILKIVDTKGLPQSELQRVFDIFQSALSAYFDSKKSQMKIDFLKEIFRRRPWIGHYLLKFLLEKSCSSKSEFRKVEALDLVIEVLKPLKPGHPDEALSNKTWKDHLPKLSRLIKELVSNMPDKQSRRSEVRKFCSKVFQFVTKLDLTKSFLEALGADGEKICESQLGETFLALKCSQPVMKKAVV